MANKTPIQWTDETVNFFLADRGDNLGWFCRKISSGCTNCYASTLNVSWGSNTARRGNGLPFVAGSATEIEPVFKRDALRKLSRKRNRIKIFPNDMTDTFCSLTNCRNCGETWEDENIAWSHCRACSSLDLKKFWPSEWIQEALDYYDRLARAGHIVQSLTKRPTRMADELRIWSDRHWRPLHRNVWCGFSAEDQSTFDARFAEMVDVSWYADGLIWCSYEPALGPIDFSSALLDQDPEEGTSLGWVVLGGESGNGARPLDVEWIRRSLLQLEQSGCPAFVKQLGSHVKMSRSIEWPDETRDRPAPDGSLAWCPKLLDKKGGTMSEWPRSLRVREMPYQPGDQDEPGSAP